MDWNQLGLVAGVLSPLVGAPLVMITLYLRAIREHQTSTMGEVTHRIETMETSIRDLLRCTASFEREYTTKEEWVRESMLARQRLEKLTEMVTRIETELENGQGLAAQIGRATAAMAELAGRLCSAGADTRGERRGDRDEGLAASGKDDHDPDAEHGVWGGQVRMRGLVRW